MANITGRISKDGITFPCPVNGDNVINKSRANWGQCKECEHYDKKASLMMGPAINCDHPLAKS